MSAQQFSATEQKILAVLADGIAHSKDEIREVLDGEYTTDSTIATHIWRLRRKLGPQGTTIVCVTGGRGMVGRYRHVRLTAPASE